MNERSVLLNQALNVRFDADFGNDVTVRDWLYTLLSTLWSEQENFSSKQPFGSNDWSEGLYIPLITSGFIKNGKFDENGYLVSYGNGSEFVEELIKFVFYGKTMTNHTDLPITGHSNILRRALKYMEAVYNGEELLGEDPAVLRDDLRTAIENGGWLPIEKAKKDGTQYLITRGDDEHVGSWKEGLLGHPSRGEFMWRASCCGRTMVPTHCKPLPPPPNSPKRESE